MLFLFLFDPDHIPVYTPLRIRFLRFLKIRKNLQKKLIWIRRKFLLNKSQNLFPDAVNDSARRFFHVPSGNRADLLIKLRPVCFSPSFRIRSILFPCPDQLIRIDPVGPEVRKAFEGCRKKW